MALLGLFGWVTISLPYWNWYGFDPLFTLAAGLEEGIGWLIAGVVRPARVAEPAPAEPAAA